MATSQLTEIVRHLRRTVLLRDGADLTDGQLLDAFITGRDEVAFAALVQRHGAMVWGVCRRVLDSHHDAEDAFQAAFLVLVRKACSIRPREQVASWLYGVAYRTARKARASALRRRAREQLLPTPPEPAAPEPVPGPELPPLLDRELNSLPDRYRLAIILCDLEGKTRKEAARLVQVPEGTLSGHLARGRLLLARRLARRGLALSVALAAQQQAAAGAPAAMVTATLQAASGAAPAPVVRLADLVLRSMCFAQVKVLSSLVVFLGVLGAGGLALSQRGTQPLAAAGQAVPGEAKAEGPARRPTTVNHQALLNQLWSRGRAEGKGPVPLRNLGLRTEDIGAVIPMGAMVHGHVIPSDHLMIQPRDRKATRAHYDVLAPADGYLVDLQRPPKGNPDPGVQGRYAGEYRLVLEHSSTFYTWFGLIDRLDPALLQQIGGEPPAGMPVGVRVPVKAGQVLGKTGGEHGMDFLLVDTDVVLTGFVDPGQFRHRDPWKLHVVDPFEYLEKPARDQLLALNPRTAPPRGGKIDHDRDGCLVGSWYRAKTGGYAGLDRRRDYWVGHLALAYHHVDPSLVIVSLGDSEGRPRQFAVVGNGPDPARVRLGTGRVTYELVWPRIGSAGQALPGLDDRVQGVLLVELLGDRRLRVETFPSKRAADVPGFTAAAQVYER